VPRVVWVLTGVIVELTEDAFGEVVVIDGTILKKLFWFNWIKR